MVDFHKEVKLQNYVSRTISKRRWGFLSSRCLCRWRNQAPTTNPREWIRSPGSRLHATFEILFYWSRVDVQCCVSFRCAAKWFIYVYVYECSFLWMCIYVFKPCSFEVSRSQALYSRFLRAHTLPKVDGANPIFLEKDVSAWVDPRTLGCGLSIFSTLPCGGQPLRHLPLANVLQLVQKCVVNPAGPLLNA